MLKSDGIPNHKSIKMSILPFTTSTFRKCITQCLLSLTCNEINNKGAQFGQTIFNPWPTLVARKLRKTEILKFAECCKFTTAADLNNPDLYNFAFLSFELRLSRVSCVVSGLARTDPHVSLLTLTQRNENYYSERHTPSKCFFFPIYKR